jgi:hypothetical protein
MVLRLSKPEQILPAAVGDEVWLLEQGAILYVLRPRKNKSNKLFSEAYVHSIIRGEWMMEGREKEFKAHRRHGETTSDFNVR